MWLVLILFGIVMVVVRGPQTAEVHNWGETAFLIGGMTVSGLGLVIGWARRWRL